MVAGARLEGVRAVRAAHAARRTEHDRRAFVVRLVSCDARRRAIGMLVPGALELGAIALRAVALEEFLVLADIGLDEILRGLLEDRPPFLGVGVEQRRATPALEAGGDLPTQIGDVVEPVVEPIGAVGRMAVGGVARDKDAPDLILLRNRDAQVPEPHIVELARETEAGGALQQAMEVIIVARRIGRHRRVEEPALLGIDAAEELPVALEVGMHHAISGSRRKALELLVELARPKECQHHELVEIRAGTLDADLLTDGGMAAVAAHDVIGRDGLAPRLLHDGDPRFARVLFDRFRRPAVTARDIGKLGHALAQHLLGLILRQPLVVLEVVGVDDLAQRRRVPVVAGEALIRDDAVHRIVGRQHARGAQLVRDAPEIEMLDRALGEVLPLRDPLRLGAALDQHAGYAAQPQIDRERHADRPAAHDRDLIAFVVGHWPFLVFPSLGIGAGEKRGGWDEPVERLSVRPRASPPARGAARSSAAHDTRPCTHKLERRHARVGPLSPRWRR